MSQDTETLTEMDFANHLGIKDPFEIYKEEEIIENWNSVIWIICSILRNK